MLDRSIVSVFFESAYNWGGHHLVVTMSSIYGYIYMAISLSYEIIMTLWVAIIMILFMAI